MRPFRGTPATQFRIQDCPVISRHGLQAPWVPTELGFRPRFIVSNFWKELFRLSGTKLRMRTTYHPQTNDQTEVMNHILEQYLHTFVHDRPSQWYHFLLLAEWSYNTSTHSGTCISPFEAIYRKPLLSIPHYILGDMTVEAVDSLLATRTVILAGLRRRLIKAQTNMKTVANTHCRSLEFTVGNWVYVCLRPYRQTSFAPAYTKLAK